MSWFEQITGFTELGYEDTQARLRLVAGHLINEVTGVGYPVGTLEFVSLDTLRVQARDAKLPGKLALRILEGDVRRLHADPANSGAVFQVASQFNLLEMVGPNVSPEQGVTRYIHDHTQGPACAIAAGAGTIWRNYLVPNGDQIGQTADRQLDGLASLAAALANEMGVAPDELWHMRNGYALPDQAQLSNIADHLQGLSEMERERLRGLLRVGLHWNVGVTDAEAARGARVTQVYCSALPVAYSQIAPSLWTSFATLVLEAAYEATLLSAVLNAARGGTRRLLLTRIGGGAFGNDEAWISDAILRALDLGADQGLEVLMVSYGAPSSAVRNLERVWSARQGML